MNATCRGCGTPLSPKRGRGGGLPKKWCGDGCRIRTLRMGLTDGYADVLLADPCAYCGGESTTIDHIVPRNANGESNWENLAGACAFCNSQKSKQPLIHFLLARRLWAELEGVRSELSSLKAA